MSQVFGSVDAKMFGEIELRWGAIHTTTRK
jgi:hypothetical protein